MSDLVVDNLVLAYGAIEAVRGVSFCLGAGELVALIGANGAGKSTTLKGLAGLVPARQGEVRLGGVALASLPAHQRVSAGLSLVPEGRGLFPRLSVHENLLMGAYLRRDGGVVLACGNGVSRCAAPCRAVNSRWWPWLGH